VITGYFGIYDFDLPHGRVVHDYLEDEELWQREDRPAEALGASA
jgi:hypothetical protein